MIYPIIEHFHSFQGEGCHAGKSAFFIRLAGCPVRCPWCDSAGTWSGNAVGNAEKISAEDLANLAGTAKPEIVVITGGEPTIHDLNPLVDALHARGLRVHLETCGAFAIRGNVDWVTVSPKLNKLPLAENWARANELKFIITCEDDLEMWREMCNSQLSTRNSQLPTCWLHPEWSVVSEKKILAKISEFICSHGAPWRAGWQLHKLYFVK